MTPRLGPAALAGALLVAAWLRLGALAREGLWLDELFTVRVATRPSWGELYAELARDVHPPLWFALLRLLPEGGDAGWRLPSALVGLLGVGLAALVARRLAGGGTYSERSTLLAAGLCATAPGLVLLDREARANAALSAAALALVALVLRPPPPRWRWTLGILAAALVNLHPFGILVVVAVAASLFVDPGDGTQLSRRGGVALVAVAAAALVPWAATTLMGQAEHFAASPWYTAPPGDSLGWVLTELADNQAGYLAIPALGLVLAARQEGPAERRGLVLVVVFSAALVLVPQAMSYGFAPVLRSRSALPLLPILLVAAALGLARAGRLGMLLGGLACAAQLLGSWHATRVETRMEQWREAAGYVEVHAAPGEPVLGNHPQLWRVYLADRIAVREVTDAGIDAAPGAWLLLGHDLDAPRGVLPEVAEAAARPPGAEDFDAFGARVRRVGPLSRELVLVVLDGGTGASQGTTAALWGAGGVEARSIRARGACAVEVRAHEDAAGAEPSRLRVRLFHGDTTLLDETRDVSGAAITTAAAPPVDTLGGDDSLRVQVDFVNDAVVEGQDRNAYVDGVRLRCGTSGGG